jgi:hypothetical protein
LDLAEGPKRKSVAFLPVAEEEVAWSGASGLLQANIPLNQIKTTFKIVIYHLFYTL